MDPDKRLRQRMGSSAFSEAEVARIKALLRKGHSRRQLALAYGVALGTISKIAREETFAWVQPDYVAPPEGSVEQALEQAITPEMQAKADESLMKLQKLLEEQK